MAIQYIPLEEKNLSALGVETPTFTAEASNSLLPTTTFLFTLCFMIIVAAAFWRLVQVGGLRLQASEDTLRRSNDIFKKVVYGLAGSFALFILLATLNSQFVTGNVSLTELRTQFKGGVSAGTGSGGSQSQGSSTPQSNQPVDTNYAARKASHEQVVARLAPSGIHTNYNDAPCTEAQFKEKTPACTSLAYLPEQTIQMLLAINAACKCTIVITGGTEPGHKSHGENKRPVDLRLGGTRGDTNNSDALYVFLKGVSGTKLGSNSNCYEQYTWQGFTFCDEKPPTPQHFHVF